MANGIIPTPEFSQARATHVVGIGEIAIADGESDILITYSLGSCVGLSLFDPVRRIGGLLHAMLPLSRINESKATNKPGMFADTGVTSLIQQLLDHGASRKRLVAKVAGGAAPLDDKGTFRIGERNYVVLRKVLWKNDILVAGENVGGTAPRTMVLYIGSGKTIVRMQKTEIEL